MARSRAARTATWRQQVQAWERSGLSQAAFCRRERLVLATFRWRLHELRHQAGAKVETPVRFVECHVAGPEIPAAPPAVELVLQSGHVIRVGAGFDPETLARLLAVVESRRC